MTDFERLLRALGAGGVEFVVIGGLAANAHGAIRTTRDLDIVYARTAENHTRLARALAPLHPYLRGAPAGLPFRLDEPTLQAGLNFTLTTSAGELDLLGEVAGGGTYQALIPHSRRLDLLGTTCWCVDLDTLIRLKQAAGRPKDFEALAELVALREERDRPEP
ncbi:MAG: hypothetical protein FJW27_16115 [Acidimicrobiia bacterium]|nr:hypothetical protein [Acidimicrobiia bacterium]